MAIEDLQESLRDPMTQNVGYKLRRCSMIYMAHLTEGMETLNLRPTEAIFLLFVAQNPGCNQADISRALGVKRTNMVPTVNELVKQGLVERTAADGRTNSLSLTPAGELQYERLQVIVEQCEERFLGGMDRDRVDDLLKTLDEIWKRGAE